MTTVDDLKDFEAFCRNATDNQLYEIYCKEMEAGRNEYASVAYAVGIERGISYMWGGD